MLEEVPINRAESRADLEWFVQHWETISADPRYKNGYVAIKDGRIIDSDQDGNALDTRTRDPHTEEARGVIVAVTEMVRQDIESILKTDKL